MMKTTKKHTIKHDMDYQVVKKGYHAKINQDYK